MALSGQDKVLVSVSYLTNAAANVYNNSSALLYTIVKHIHFCNVTNSSATMTMYIGLTGGSTGGTEIFKLFPIGANGTYDYFCRRKMLSTDFLTGLASASSTITIEIEGEQVVV
jgi:hypothetical protein